jgi:hypothetical protein
LIKAGVVIFSRCDPYLRIAAQISHENPLMWKKEISEERIFIAMGLVIDWFTPREGPILPYETDAAALMLKEIFSDYALPAAMRERTALN